MQLTDTAELPIYKHMKTKKTVNFISAYFDVELRGQRSVYVKADDCLSNQVIRTARKDDAQSV